MAKQDTSAIDTGANDDSLHAWADMSRPEEEMLKPKRAKLDEGPRSCGQDAADKIKELVPNFPAGGIKLGLILGSGMGGIADSIEDRTEIPYSELPGFPVSTVQGHSGCLVVGNLKGLPVACLKGRVHLYEGVDAKILRVPIYALKLIGCEALLLTSAVGSLREEVGAGELVCLTDHINFQGRNPMIGVNDPIGPRFPSLMDAYDPKLRAVLKKCSGETEVPIHEGVYLACLGPSFETPAEIRAFKMLGADVVGMSTVSEVIVARHCGLRVCALSIVVNLASGLTDKHITHDETLHYSNVAGERVTKLIFSFVSKYEEWKA